MAFPENVDSCPRLPTSDGTNQTVECPFGFGRRATKNDWENAIAPLCCPVCRALLYEAQRAAPCGHCYCKICSLKVKDCLLCAADIVEFATAADVDSDVESFIRAHSHNIELLQSDQTCSAQIESEIDLLLKRTTFLLYQSLKALKGANSASALMRLQQAESELKDKTEQKCVNQRSIILGKISDILLSENELEKAAQYAEQACCLLEETLSTGELVYGQEVIGILSTSHGKAGDIYALLENDDLAVSHYSRSVVLKEQLSKFVSGEDTSMSLQKALLLAKLADKLNLAARKRASEAQKLVDSLTPLDWSDLSERDQKVLEYVNNSVESILGK
ncbi:hypothetical protein GpartN1_g7478.t1 [Galdieria partita]|uniref:RING-type domain-containing protein n=1 Tax=Galdieria partita TaxID=83374 RepID=A0A9C7Q6R6_9RHOD|nr:hypothetical protein GpartN1_g7478.t1 [Galdieria partita]